MGSKVWVVIARGYGDSFPNPRRVFERVFDLVELAFFDNPIGGTKKSAIILQYNDFEYAWKQRFDDNGQRPVASGSATCSSICLS